MDNRDLYLAAYDICAPDRLRDALNLVKAFATGGQKSVFECFLSPAERRRLLTDMGEALDLAEDTFLLLRLDPRAKVIVLGRAVAPEDPPFFYHG